MEPGGHYTDREERVIVVIQELKKLSCSFYALAQVHRDLDINIKKAQ